MRKYIIEISDEGMRKIFIDGDKQYIEEWGCDAGEEYGTIEAGITEQLNEEEKSVDPYLLELLDQGELDLFELLEYFQENKEAKSLD